MKWIIILIVLIIIVRKMKGSYKIQDQSVVMYSGTIGSGKTYLAVDRALSAYGKQATIHKRGSGWRRWLGYRFFHPDWKYSATLYSNIPIKLGKDKWSTPIKLEHFTMQEPLPEKCVILLDEVGAFASQWEFDNPYIAEKLQFFMRYFRQFLDGRMILTDQSVGRVCKPLRELIGRVYWLHDFHRKWRILPVYEVSCLPLLMIEDQTSRMDDDGLTPDQTRMLRGWFPYRWMKGLRKYDSRCYSPLYQDPAVRHCDSFYGFKTDYLIDVTVPGTIKQEFKMYRNRFHEWVYQARWKPDYLDNRLQQYWQGNP